ncbi:GNAT family N-acetyltransferase [Actinomadura kijaniata]|uniref:GNAT family N-acetyltransferase n=1 Tax=Actinomadura kijaniata TaxID=46161 RepID=UPI00350E3A5A
MLSPESRTSAGNDETALYSGHLVGFLIVRDRDENGIYESVAHIWTASSWRRRGIARRLLNEARARFPIAEVEGPYTEDGSAFLDACPIEADGH